MSYVQDFDPFDEIFGVAGETMEATSKWIRNSFSNSHNKGDTFVVWNRIAALF